jgi:hypothetical protein
MKPLTPDDIDRELHALLTVEPSPSFVARVRIAVASEPAPSRVPGVLVGWTVTLATVLLVAVSVYWAGRADDTSITSASRAQNPVVAAPAPDVIPASPSAAIAPQKEVRATINSGHRVQSVPSPQVLVSTDDRQAFERLVRGTADGTFVLSFEQTTDRLTTAELTIAPITTEPLFIPEQQGVDQ